MSKNSTLNFLINSYNNGVLSDVTDINNRVIFSPDLNNDQFDYEPSESSIKSILSFASQYDVIKTTQTGNIELNLN